MQNDVTPDIDTIMLDAEREVAQEDKHITRAEERSFFAAAKDKVMGGVDFAGSVGGGVVEGAANAVGDGISTVTDIAIIAGVELGAGIGNTFSDGYDADARIKEFQGIRNQLTGYLNNKEDDDEVKNFVMNTTESIAKYAFIWKQLGKTGLSAVQKAAYAGAGEGFTNDPERELMFLDNNVRTSINMLSPESVADFDRLMDVDKTDSQTATQLTRRIMSALEVSLISAGGEKVISAAPAAGKVAAQYIPDAIKEKVVDGMGFLLERSRQAKEFIKGGKPEQTFDDFVVSSAGGDKRGVSYNPEAIKADGSLLDNVKASVQVRSTTKQSIPTAEAYGEQVKELEDELFKLIPQIRDDVVSMSKSQGVAENETLKRLAQESGMSLKQFNSDEGLKRVIQMQAHNIMLKEQTLKVGLLASQKAKGVISDTQFNSGVRDYLITLQQRQAVASSAGLTLRASQEVAVGVKKLGKGIDKQIDETSRIMGSIDEIINDDEALKIFSEGMEETLGIAGIVGDTPEALEKAIVKGMKKSSGSGTQKAGNLARQASKIYQMNLLSSPVTLAQNTIGANAMTVQVAAETATAALIGKATRNKAAPTFAEAFIQMQEAFTTQMDYIVLAGKVAKNKALTGKGGYAKEMEQFTEIASMTDSQKKRLMHTQKSDIAQVNEAPTEMSMLSQVATGAPIAAVIKTQDTIAKVAAARGYMNGRINTLIYGGDILGLRSLGKSGQKKAAQVATKMFKEGRVNLDAKELEQLGFTKGQAMRFETTLEKARIQASEEAVDHAQSIVFQTPLSPNMKAVQEVLQDTIPFGRFLVPFFSTPVNIINETIKRAPMIPLGEGLVGLPIHPAFYKEFAAGGVRRQKVVARLAMGNGLVQAGIMLQEKGILQHTPDSIDERMGLDMMGIQPSSVVIGKASYSLAALGPIGILLSLGGGMSANRDKYYQLESKGEDAVMGFQDAFLHNFTGFMSVMREAPYAQAADEIMSILEFDAEDENAVEAAQKKMARIAGNMMPYSSLFRTIYNNSEGERVKQRSVSDAFFSQFMPAGLPKAYNVFGEVMQPNQGWITRSRNTALDPTMTAIVEGAGYFPRAEASKFMHSTPSGAVEVELTDEQRVAYFNNIQNVQKLRESLDNEVKSDKYAQNYRDGRYDANKKEVQSIISKAQKKALETVIEQDYLLQLQVEKEIKNKYTDQVTLQAPAGQAPTSFTGGQ